MLREIKVGIEGKASTVVNKGNTAMAYGSGAVNVFATPAMVALMEKAALSSVDPLLDAGYTTVGTKIEVKHMAATPMGMNVTATSRLVEVNGKRLLFNIEVKDEVDLVGTGVHERFIVELAGFIKRVEGKAASK
ncbi:thioesterase family protein [Pelotomaculum terephthalicicum JT]|uniref:thioesterase family protein n=1 Tax=Pelotomaculum TaxID=191373 RepID=UPI0009CD9DBE|nr:MULTISPECIES: thioesterase family protein [Pelotomaculum]MCG9968054.1 thioesterase family protein [Pelotomaculum terephthalicicum JT]OPX85649.1 MAG: Fluoroacetyl-CoA thioesterase [Pelotomaculum sp. PtaB.Bin117]OPY63979.1 MAG: Fluoroacetyl-CoA thioesterase [Pelotomaculum sp. PtaU1.Bin065]